MKKSFALLALSALLGTGAAFALPQADSQEPAPDQHQDTRRRPDPERQVKNLTKRLNLNADQQSKILSILKDRAQQVQSLRSDSSLSDQDRHAKMQAIRQDTGSRIQAVLTPEQKQQYEQMQQQARERFRERHQGTDSN